MWHFNIDKKWQKWISANRDVNKLYPQFPVLPRSPPFWRRVYYCWLILNKFYKSRRQHSTYRDVDLYVVIERLKKICRYFTIEAGK